MSPDGGIGRRVRLKIWCPQGCAGSIPVLGTQKSLESVDFQGFLPLVCVSFTCFLPLFTTFFDTKKTHSMTQRISGCRKPSATESNRHQSGTKPPIFLQKILSTTTFRFLSLLLDENFEQLATPFNKLAFIKQAHSLNYYSSTKNCEL